MLKLAATYILSFVAIFFYSLIGCVILAATVLWVMWIFTPGNTLWALLTFAGVGVYLLFESAKR